MILYGDRSPYQCKLFVWATNDRCGSIVPDLLRFTRHSIYSIRYASTPAGAYLTALATVMDLQDSGFTVTKFKHEDAWRAFNEDTGERVLVEVVTDESNEDA